MVQRKINTQGMSMVFYAVLLMALAVSGCTDNPVSQETITADDGSTWERVNESGFGSSNNYSVPAMAEYQGHLYAMTRNEAQGVEVWRTAGASWEQVLFPGGVKNGIYGNPFINNLWGSMVLFRGKLYCGFSSGVQGNVLKSTGCEIWRYDGKNWEAVISDKKDVDEAGAITAIAGCDENDADTTAQFIDSSKAWAADQWAGGVLQITSGSGQYRRFDIISNSADTLVVQQNEVAGMVNYTICAAKHFNNPFPPYEYDLGAVEAGDIYEIGLGTDENGFGDYWNKTITGMTVFENTLYVSTGLNYPRGAQVWYTADGDTWKVTDPPNSFGNFHDDASYPNGKKPVSTSITKPCPSSASGETVLYAGGNGLSGNRGSCSRMAKLTNTGWELIVDSSVDDNETGTNENGFGGGMDCTMFTGNFIPWSLASFDNKLFVGVQSLGGARVVYSSNGSSADGNWQFSVGGNSGMPAGFDGEVNAGITAALGETVLQNIAVTLFPFKSNLYAGLVSVYAPTVGATQEYLPGSQIWKTGDGKEWKPVTQNGFGDRYIINFEAFTEFNGALYVSGSKGCVDCPYGLDPKQGAKIFRSADKRYPK